ncbi:sperm head and tail associated protein-like [Choloepus didactylus]|uniref:sperm head and tail associated protein-like n=1 Tax=Choloepus didactylus TaxID=27675 RepID=UPI00189CCFC9|nr:sperm head and tail associated protein-like [Choloepus didactylus]
MTSSPPFLLELPVRPTSPLRKCLNDSPFLFSGSPPPSGKGFSPFLTLELPLAPRKGYSEHPAQAPELSPNPGKRCSDSPHPLGSSHFSRDAFPGLASHPGVTFVTGPPPSPPRTITSPPPPPASPPLPLRPGRYSFEPCSPRLLTRLHSRGPSQSCSPPPSPNFGRFSRMGSPSSCPRSPYCNGIRLPRLPRSCPRSPHFDRHTYLCYCSEYSSAPGTGAETSSTLAHQTPGIGPLTSPPHTHVPLETGPIISPSLAQKTQGTGSLSSPPCTHVPLETGPMISPSLAQKTRGTGPLTSPSCAHVPLETGPMISPSLAHQTQGTGPLTSPPCSHVPLETGPMISFLAHQTPGTGSLTSSPFAHEPLETDPMISLPVTHSPQETGPMISPLLTHVPPRTSPLISSPLPHGPQGTCPMISPPLTHRPLGTGLVISPPLTHLPVETRPIVSPSLSHRLLETGPTISPLPSRWPSERSYNDPPLSPESLPPTSSFHHGCLKPPDSCEPKPHLDLPLGENYCGSSLSSHAGISDFPSPPQEGSYHNAPPPPEAHIPAPGNPYSLPPGCTCSPCPLQSQIPRKPCFGSMLSWETGGSSFLFLTPGTMISGPPSSQEPPPSLSSPCSYSALPFPSPMSNQFIFPSQSPPCRGYNELPLPTLVSPQRKTLKSSELRQSRTSHRCRSKVALPQPFAPGQYGSPKASTSPPPPSCPSSLSIPCKEPSVTTASNSCPKELPPGTALPTVIPRILKTAPPPSLPLCLPCDPAIPQRSPHGLPIGSHCSTHIYSVVPSTPHPGLLSDFLSHSTGHPQCHNQPMVPPCCTHSTPRPPPQPHRQPVLPPCSTHIYSFIPLRTPFDPKSLPIAPRAQVCPDITPCGFHVYSVASQGSCKEPPQIPYSCPLPSSKSSSCTTNPNCSSTIISESQSNDSQSKSIVPSGSGSPICQSRSQSPSRNPNHTISRSQSESPPKHQSGPERESLLQQKPGPE